MPIVLALAKSKAPIQKSPIKSGIKTKPKNKSTLACVNSKKPHQIGD